MSLQFRQKANQSIFLQPIDSSGESSKNITHILKGRTAHICPIQEENYIEELLALSINSDDEEFPGRHRKPRNAHNNSPNLHCTAKSEVNSPINTSNNGLSIKKKFSSIYKFLNCSPNETKSNSFINNEKEKFTQRLIRAYDERIKTCRVKAFVNFIRRIRFSPLNSPSLGSTLHSSRGFLGLGQIDDNTHNTYRCNNNNGFINYDNSSSFENRMGMTGFTSLSGHF